MPRAVGRHQTSASGTRNTLPPNYSPPTRRSSQSGGARRRAPTCRSCSLPRCAGYGGVGQGRLATPRPMTTGALSSYPSRMWALADTTLRPATAATSSLAVVYRSSWRSPARYMHSTDELACASPGSAPPVGPSEPTSRSTPPADQRLKAIGGAAARCAQISALGGGTTEGADQELLSRRRHGLTVDEGAASVRTDRC